MITSRPPTGASTPSGDVVGGPQFTHLANYHAGIVIRNALFRLKPDASAANIPRVVYTDPELAQIGMTEAEGAQALSPPHPDLPLALCRQRPRPVRARDRGLHQGHHAAGWHHSRLHRSSAPKLAS
jgi:pyruvate/2-oxoglutarate dehydrogenase complex dihydrolipoamide dehydrogenase (E3) component